MKNTKMTGTSQQELTSILKWRLNKAITIEDVTTLLDKELVSKEEAKQLLFNTEAPPEPSSEKEKALKEQIKFLETVVEKLAHRGTLTVWPNVTITPSYPVKYWINAGNSGIGSGTGIYAVNTASNTVSLSSGITSHSNTIN